MQISAVYLFGGWENPLLEHLVRPPEEQRRQRQAQGSAISRLTTRENLYARSTGRVVGLAP
jgi:hypothetical protein